MVKRIVLTGLVIIVVVALIVFYQSQESPFSKAPPELANAVSINSKASSIAVNIRLAFDQLNARANRALPLEFSDSRDGQQRCKRILGANVCATAQYSYHATRGPIAISAGANNSIHLSVPISINGQVGFKGKAARTLGLNKKNIRASLEAYSDVEMSIGADWCPNATIRSNFRWLDDAKVEIFAGVWAGINKLVEDKLRSQLQKLGDDVLASIRCDEIKRTAQKAWVAYSFPLSMPDEEGALFVNIRPETFAFSGLQVMPEKANMALALTAKLDIAAQPAPALPLTLPNLQPATQSESEIKLIVPINLTYSRLEQRLFADIKNKRITAKTSAGTFTVIPKRIKLYPSAKDLVIAVYLNIDFPYHWHRVKGWVYLKAKPVAVSQGSALKFDNLSFSNALDDTLWNSIAVVLNDTIKSSLQQKATVNLAGTINHAKKSVLRQFSKPHAGIMINIGDPRIKLGRVVLAADRLVVEVLFSSKADIALQVM